MTEIERRRFLGRAAVGVAAYVSAPFCSTGAPVGARPNILVVIADDQTIRDAGCYGSPDVKTPNIDRLAAEGMKFMRAFTATAMCAPTRTQLYTGLYPVRNGAWPNHSGVFPHVKSLPHYLHDLGYRVALAGKTHIKPKANFPFDYIGGSAEQIGKWIDQGRGKPFCAVLASHNPHGPYKKGGSYDAAKVTLPPYFVDTPETREMFADYLHEIALLDQEIGECRDVLDARRVLDNTLLMYTSEQGSGFPFGKWTCYDTGLNVGLVARWPGVIKPASVSNAMVHYIDVTPTLVDVAGGKPIEGLDGRSFLPVLRGETDEHRDVVYGVHTTRGIINGSESYAIRSIRTQTHKLILNLNHDVAFTNAATKGKVWESWVAEAETDGAAAALVKRYQHRPPVELYDVVTDPLELDNVAEKPANREVVAELRQRLLDWMKEQGDEGVATEMRARERQGSRGGKGKEKGSGAGNEKKRSDASSRASGVGGNPERVFRLKQGDTLAGKSVPDVAGRGLRIVATVQGSDLNGAILAQGAQAFGYALIVRNSKPVFVVSEAKKPVIVAAPEALTAGKHEIVATLGRGGEMSLNVDGKTVASGKAPGPLSKTPADVLDVGRDLGNPVLVDYEPPFAFTGAITGLVLELDAQQ